MVNFAIVCVYVCILLRALIPFILMWSMTPRMTIRRSRLFLDSKIPPNQSQHTNVMFKKVGFNFSIKTNAQVTNHQQCNENYSIIWNNFYYIVAYTVAYILFAVLQSFKSFYTIPFFVDVCFCTCASVCVRERVCV